MESIIWQQLLFFIFAAMTIMSAVMVVVAKNPVRAALFLVLAFFNSAGIWLLARAEFLALILILVYVGAVMTLFLFVIMMMNIDLVELKRSFIKYLPVGVGIVVALLALMFVALKPENFGFGHLVTSDPASLAPDFDNTKALGEILYTKYAYPFELAAVLLLIAMISAIALVFRGPRNCKTQRPDQQIRTKAKDRIRLVDIKPGE